MLYLRMNYIFLFLIGSSHSAWLDLIILTSSARLALAIARTSARLALAYARTSARLAIAYALASAKPRTAPPVQDYRPGRPPLDTPQFSIHASPSLTLGHRLKKSLPIQGFSRLSSAFSGGRGAAPPHSPQLASGAKNIVCPTLKKQKIFDARSKTNSGRKTRPELQNALNSFISAFQLAKTFFSQSDAQMLSSQKLFFATWTLTFVRN